MTKATVLGARGFIGAVLETHLAGEGVDVLAPERAQLPDVVDGRAGPLGVVYYCIGLTADFRDRPLDTVEAHVGLVTRLLARAQFDGLVYLSSTRVYSHSADTAEDVALSARPEDPSDLYNLTKLAGEAACLSSGRDQVRVCRLSNVYGAADRSDNFLNSIVRDAVAHGRVDVGQDPASEKDYVAVEDVAHWLGRIGRHGTRRIYNLAAGHNTTHRDLLSAIAAKTGASVAFRAGAAVNRFPPIDTSRVVAEFGRPRKAVLSDLDIMIAAARAHRT
jgi:nucleoside-diphosphate-sugar epimerase